MKILIVLTILAALIVSGVIYFTRADVGQKTGPIIFFGDSITSGFGTDAGKDFTSILKTKFDQEMINAGLAGDTTETALRRLETDVVQKNPSLVVIELGGNDFLLDISPTTTEDNLDQIITKTKTTGAEIILLGIRSGTENVDKIYIELGERLAKNHNITFESNVFNGIFADESLMADLVHPNSAGHELIAQRLEKVLKDKGY